MKLTAEQIEEVVASALIEDRELIEQEGLGQCFTHEDYEGVRELLHALDVVISYYTVQE